MRESTSRSNQAPEPVSKPADGAAAVADNNRIRERRQTVVDRRTGVDRREAATPAAASSAFDRRRGPGRRRTDYRRDAEEGHMNEEQLEFIRSIDEYKRVNCRPFPTWTEVLDVVLYLGYRKVAPIGEFKLCKGRMHPRKDQVEEAEEEFSVEEAQVPRSA
jgi:hypothetical protein